MIYKSQLASSIASIITGSFNESNSESILVYDSQVGCQQNYGMSHRTVALSTFVDTQVLG